MANLSEIAADPRLPPAYSALLCKGDVDYSPAVPFHAPQTANFRSARLAELRIHHAAQPTMTTCSATSAQVLVNTLRHRHRMPPCSVADILATDTTSYWHRRLADLDSRGVSLADFAPLLENALKHLQPAATRVEVHTVRILEPNTKSQIRELLLRMEREPNMHILLNFLQSTYMADGFSVGHMSVVGGYDPEHRQVAVLDVDIRGLEPYWVGFDLFLQGLCTYDADGGDHRGLLVVTLG